MRILGDIILVGSTPTGGLIEIPVQVKELTTGEIRAWLKASGMVCGDIVDCTLFDDFSLPDLSVLTTLTAEQIDQLPPSELRRARQKAEEINADFFAMRNRVVQLGRQALANNSNEPLPLLPPLATPTSGNTRGASFWQRVKAMLKPGSGQ